MNSQLRNLLHKQECSQYEYVKNKELFDAAVDAGMISPPERYEKSRITDGSKSDSSYWYRWRILDT